MADLNSQILEESRSYSSVDPTRITVPDNTIQRVDAAGVLWGDLRPAAERPGCSDLSSEGEMVDRMADVVVGFPENQQILKVYPNLLDEVERMVREERGDGM